MIPEARTKREKPAWWNYVKKVIREYPELRRRMETPLEPRVTGSAGTNHGGRRENRGGRAIRRLRFRGDQQPRGEVRDP